MPRLDAVASILADEIFYFILFNVSGGASPSYHFPI